MKKLTFDVWYEKIWQRAGGLISQSDAARILKKDTSRIAQMIKEGKLKRYQYENLSYVSYAEVIRAKQLKEMKKDLKYLDLDVFEIMNGLDIPVEFEIELRKNITQAKRLIHNPPEIIENAICIPNAFENSEKYDVPEHLLDHADFIEPDIDDEE